MKPGVKTSEFWVSITLIALLFGSGIFLTLYFHEIKTICLSGLLITLAWLKAHFYEAHRVLLKVEENSSIQCLISKFPWLKDHLHWFDENGPTPCTNNPTPCTNNQPIELEKHIECDKEKSRKKVSTATIKFSKEKASATIIEN